MRWRKPFILFLIFFFSLQSQAMDITGRIELEEGWQPLVFLAALNSPSDLFVASPDFILSETLINPDGSFQITTSDVPDNPRFYRLYLVKTDNLAVEFNTSVHRNFVHLLLDRNSSIEIQARISNNKFQVDALNGSLSAENRAILQFDEEYNKRKELLEGDITKVRRDFLTNDLGTFIRQFVDDQSNSLVGLYALFHIDEKETDFLMNSEFYFDFQKKLIKQYPAMDYTEAYNDLLKELIGFRDYVCEMPGVQPKWKDQLLVLESILIVFLLIIIVWLIVKQRKIRKWQSSTGNSKQLYAGLTSKQQEILSMLADGKTNKEIATALFIEISTVKTHINNIYRQLNVENRRDAIEFLKSLQEQ
jgi:DNA-binding CsgD family transcriptional regulator